ncbi:MAG: DUF2975 domain-containing protein [Chloroflexota bacterium]
MKQGSTTFLKAVVSLIGLAVLAVCIFALPVGIRESGTSGYGPIFIGMYVTALPFFFALYQTMKLLGYIDKNNAFSELSVEALKNIKICAIIISALFGAAMPYIFVVAENDDAPGVVVMGLVIVLASLAVATFAAVLQRLLREALDLKTENELTV